MEIYTKSIVLVQRIKKASIEAGYIYVRRLSKRIKIFSFYTLFLLEERLVFGLRLNEIF